jgi:hypothetical protein
MSFKIMAFLLAPCRSLYPTVALLYSVPGQLVIGYAEWEILFYIRHHEGTSWYCTIATSKMNDKIIQRHRTSSKSIE